MCPHSCSAPLKRYRRASSPALHGQQSAGFFSEKRNCFFSLQIQLKASFIPGKEDFGEGGGDKVSTDFLVYPNRARLLKAGKTMKTEEKNHENKLLRGTHCLCSHMVIITEPDHYCHRDKQLLP